MKTKNRRWFVVSLLVLAAAAGPGVLNAQRMRAQGQPGGPGGDPLGRLKRALQQAGAPELSVSQEDQLNALISEHRAAMRSQRPEGGPGGDRIEWEKAILAGDLGRADALAASMAASIAEMSRARLQSQASLSVQVLNVLKGTQLDLLLAKFGTSGVFRLVSFAGGGMRGPAGRGPGGPGGND